MNVNIYDAKTNLSKLIDLIVSNQESTINICKNGKPLVTMSIYNENNLKKRRIGAGKGIIESISFEDFKKYSLTEDDLLNLK